MALRFGEGEVHFDDHCVVEDAMPLLAFLEAEADPQVRLAHCTGMHTALIQVLAAIRPRIGSWPAAPGLARLLGGLMGMEPT